jgi:hypothetical protein
MAELADAADSKSAEGNLVGVRPPLPAPLIECAAYGLHFSLCPIEQATSSCRLHGDGKRLGYATLECKQAQPAAQDVEQLRRYLRHFFKETKLKARGILVHGGSKKLHADVEAAASKALKIEVIQHRLEVEFSRCS